MDEKKRISIVIPQSLIAAIKKLAQQHRRSFVGEIVWALQQYVHQQEGD
jgi:hypothetical protein